jgi:uncharacterized membrane protein
MPTDILTAEVLSAALVAFLASVVEFAEAATIVLAVGMSRGWRSALSGAVGAAAVLILITLLAGVALAVWVPEAVLQLLVGTLLVIFGLQWLRGAVLRVVGRKGHGADDGLSAPPGAPAVGSRGLDWFGFVVAFKGVLLEGLEVVFIVLTIGASAGSVPAAAGGAAASGVVVIAVAFLVRRQVGRLPANTVRLAVGVLIATFGTYWTVEGLGAFAGSGSVHWAGGDWALAGLLAGWTGCAYLAIWMLRRPSTTKTGTGTGSDEEVPV